MKIDVCLAHLPSDAFELIEIPTLRGYEATGVKLTMSAADVRSALEQVDADADELCETNKA